jgi:hypothetical protein
LVIGSLLRLTAAKGVDPEKRFLDGAKGEMAVFVDLYISFLSKLCFNKSRDTVAALLGGWAPMFVSIFLTSIAKTTTQAFLDESADAEDSSESESTPPQKKSFPKFRAHLSKMAKRAGKDLWIEFIAQATRKHIFPEMTKARVNLLGDHGRGPKIAGTAAKTTAVVQLKTIGSAVYDGSLVKSGEEREKLVVAFLANLTAIVIPALWGYMLEQGGSATVVGLAIGSMLSGLPTLRHLAPKIAQFAKSKFRFRNKKMSSPETGILKKTQ